jgi:hypothetical protein
MAITLQFSMRFAPFLEIHSRLFSDSYVLCVICPRHPTHREYIRRLFAKQVHGNLTPAGFSASSVEKYHYTLHLLSPPPKAIRFQLHEFHRSPQKRVMAHL